MSVATQGAAQFSLTVQDVIDALLHASGGQDSAPTINFKVSFEFNSARLDNDAVSIDQVHGALYRPDLVRETRADADSVLETLGAGVRVRVVESADGWSLVAADGVKLGWLPASKLLAFQ